MNAEKKRSFNIDGDTVVVMRVFDTQINQYINDYPDFLAHPRVTPTGKMWVNATRDNCPFADKDYGDCGSCKFFKTENKGDLIGVCENEILNTKRKEA